MSKRKKLLAKIDQITSVALRGVQMAIAEQGMMHVEQIEDVTIALSAKSLTSFVEHLKSEYGDSVAAPLETFEKDVIRVYQEIGRRLIANGIPKESITKLFHLDREVQGVVLMPGD